MATRRRYSDEQKAEALAFVQACRGNYRQASRKLGIPWQTLRNWHQDATGGMADVPECSLLGTEKKEALADRLEAFAHLLVGSLPGKVEDATLKDAATALGIAVDKMRLLREQPTQIVDDHGTTDDAERAARITQILESAGARRTGQPDRDRAEPPAVVN
jgi:hypothetical protein